MTITLYVGCFLLVSSFGRATPRMLAVTGAAAGAFSVLCIVQMAGWNPFGLYPYADAYTAYSGAYLGTIGNVDLVAAFLCLCIPLMAVGILRLKDRARLILFVPLALSLWVLFKMWVLAGLVGVFAGGVLAVPVVVPAGQKEKRGLAVGIIAAGVLAVAAAYLIDIGGGLFHTRLDGVNANGSDALDKGMDWAVALGISDGSNSNEPISRQQVAVMMWRYADCPTSSYRLNVSDAGDVADYAQTAIAWAMENGILGGYPDGSLRPGGSASRAHVAAMVQRFCTTLV